MLKDIGVLIDGHRLLLRGELSGITHTHETIAASVERRELTVMFCDPLGCAALSATLDPGSLRTIIGAYHHCRAALVEHSRCFVAK